MLEADASCVVVVDAAGTVHGVVTARDFLVSPTTAGVSLHQQLRRAGSLDELSRRAARLPVTLRDFTRRGLASSKVIAVHSSLVDTVVRRTIELVLRRHGDLDPTAVTWLSLGSNGRREAVLSSDVDAAVIFRDDVDAETIDSYRSVLGEVVAELTRSGLASDSHGATPAHRLFARTDEQWRAAGRRWLADPTQNKGAVLISLLVDGRPIYGDPGPTGIGQVLGELRSHPNALRLLLEHSLLQRARLRPPRTLLPRRQEPFNVKENALAPIVNLARWVALSSGSTELSTIERLRTTAGLGHPPPRRGGDVDRDLRGAAADPAPLPVRPARRRRAAERRRRPRPAVPDRPQRDRSGCARDLRGAAAGGEPVSGGTDRRLAGTVDLTARGCAVLGTPSAGAVMRWCGDQTVLPVGASAAVGEPGRPAIAWR